MQRILGISFVVLGIALAVVPFVSDCASQGKFMMDGMPMICYGNRNAELAVGIPLLVIGAAMTLIRFKSKPIFFSLSIVVIILGVVGILIPANIIGTCPNPIMTCNTIMKPAEISIGSLAIIGGIVGLIFARRMNS